MIFGSASCWQSRIVLNILNAAQGDAKSRGEQKNRKTEKTGKKIIEKTEPKKKTKLTD